MTLQQAVELFLDVEKWYTYGIVSDKFRAANNRGEGFINTGIDIYRRLAVELMKESK